jgi:hypothetical protein
MGFIYDKSKNDQNQISSSQIPSNAHSPKNDKKDILNLKKSEKCLVSMEELEMDIKVIL